MMARRRSKASEAWMPAQFPQCAGTSLQDKGESPQAVLLDAAGLPLGQGVVSPGDVVGVHG